MSYTALDPSLPTTAQTRQALTDSTRNNIAALRDDVVAGMVAGWSMAQSGGTSDKPGVITYSKSTERIRETLTWSGNQLTQRVIEYSSNSGVAYDAVYTTTHTYDGSDNVVSGNVGGFFHWIARTYTRLLDAVATLTAHIAGTGAAVHGLGTMSTQNANAVAITDGTMKGVVVGGTITGEHEPAIVTHGAEKTVDLGTIGAGGTLTIDWSLGTYFYATAPTSTANWTLAFSNIPAAGFGRCVYLFLTNGGRTGAGTLTYPSTSILKKAGGGAFSLVSSGLDIVAFVTRGDGVVHGNVGIPNSQ